MIERFAFEAFRHHEPEKAYVDQLVAMFEKSRAEGQKFDQAMGEVMAVVLASPGFLFLQEASKADGKRHELDARELAIRLAYFLWSSAPDAELYRAAADGSPGPLITHFAAHSGSLACPLYVVPGSFTNEQIDELAA